MRISKYLVDIFLVIAIIVIIGVLVRYGEKHNNTNKNSIFATPIVETAATNNEYKIRLEFSHPSAMYNRILYLTVATDDGTEDFGSFIVKDIRLWKVDGSRIINNEFTTSSQPVSVTLYEQNGSDKAILYEGVVGDVTTLNPITSDNDGQLEISITQPE